MGRLDSVVDYWDSRAAVIPRLAAKLRKCATDEARTRLAARIESDVRAHVENLSDQDLVNSSVVMADDLYKAADATEIWDAALARYLSVSAGKFSQALAERGYTVHYLIDNSFEKSAAGFQRPLVLYPEWFQAAGFLYICPQHCATLLMSKGIPASDWIVALERYDAEGRVLARRIVTRAHAEGRHYVFLDADSVPGAFGESEAFADAPGVVTICRNDAPVGGSKVVVTLPANVAALGSDALMESQ